MMKTIYSLFLIIGLSFSCSIHAEDTKPTFMRLDRIVAVVNRDAITQSQVDKEGDRLRKQLEQTGQPLPAPAEFKKQVLDNLIGKSLQIQLCQQKNITVKDEDVDKAINRIASANKLSRDQFKQAVEHSGLVYKEYREDIRQQILFQKLQQEEVGKTINFTQQDVQAFVRANKDKLSHYSSFHVVDVLIPSAENATAAQKDSLKKQALAAQTELQKGKPVDQLLKQYPYAQNNDLGWRAIGEFPALFQSRVAALSINSVTPPIEAPNGFHILKLVEAKGENVTPTDKDLKNMAYAYKLSNAVKDWVKTLRKDAYIKIMN